MYAATSKKVKEWRIVYKYNNEWHTTTTKACTYAEAYNAFKHEFNALGTFSLGRIY